MLLLRRRLLLNLLKLSDLCILIIGLVVASWSLTSTVHFKHINLSELLAARIQVSNLIIVLAMMCLWQIAYHAFCLYHSRRLESYVQEWKDIVVATTSATLVFVLGAKVFGIRVFTSYFVLVFWLSTTLLTISFRTLLRYSLKKVRAHGRNLRLVVIVGTNERAYAFARAVEENKGLGYRVIGYIDDVLYGPNGSKVELLGTLKDFPSIIRSRIVDEVIIALPIKSQYERIQEIIESAEEQGITTRCLSDLFNTKISRSNSAIFAGIPVVEMTSGIRQDWTYAAKRLTDIVLGFLLMLLASPVMLVTAVAIKLTSPGPVFFVQDRVGYRKRIFRLCKFRTMVEDADKIQKELDALNEMDGPVFKMRNDPRTTKVGRWLRKLSIDELPQLWNVIRGDMSLVGPRPLPVSDYNGFKKDWQRRRFSVRPGLTCLWQINGRNNTSFEHWMQLDMEYIDNWSFARDMKILLRTVPAVINGKGAS